MQPCFMTGMVPKMSPFQQMTISGCTLLKSIAINSCSNEEKDDLATGDLKYLAIPYLAGQLHADGPTSTLSARATALQRSRDCHLRYYFDGTQTFYMLDCHRTVCPLHHTEHLVADCAVLLGSQAPASSQSQ